jgi:hypothetical protein
MPVSFQSSKNRKVGATIVHNTAPLSFAEVTGRGLRILRGLLLFGLKN